MSDLQVRSKALIQYTAPFVSVNLNTMATAFGTDVGWVFIFTAMSALHRASHRAHVSDHGKTLHSLLFNLCLFHQAGSNLTGLSVYRSAGQCQVCALMIKRGTALHNGTGSFVQPADVGICNCRALEKELAELVAGGQVQARIDSHAKVLYARLTDTRAATFERALRIGMAAALHSFRPGRV